MRPLTLPSPRNGARVTRVIKELAGQAGDTVAYSPKLSFPPGEADAYFYTGGSMVLSQAQLVIDTANAKKLPTMFQAESLVAQGALASYGASFHEAGRLSAKYIQRILAGTNPRDLPVEGLRKLELVLNLRTAQQLGLKIPPEVLARADKVMK